MSNSSDFVAAEMIDKNEVITRLLNTCQDPFSTFKPSFISVFYPVDGSLIPVVTHFTVSNIFCNKD